MEDPVKYRDPVDDSSLTWSIVLTDSQYRELMAIFLEADASSSIALRRQLGSANCIGHVVKKDQTH